MSKHTPYIAGQHGPRKTVHLACEHCEFTEIVKVDEKTQEGLHPSRAFGPERKAFLARYAHESR
jgi:hypothetical protein